MQGLRHVESFAIRFLAGQAAVASLAGTRLRTTRSPRPGQPAPLLQRCRARNTETHHRLRLTHPTVNHGPRRGHLGLIVVCGPIYSHGKKPAPPDHAVHLLPLSHSLGRHTKPPGGQTIAKSPLKHLHRLLPKQTIMPQPQIHRHEKPPIPWTSLSMSKKREAVHAHLGVYVRIKGLRCMFRGLRASSTPRVTLNTPKRSPTSAKMAQLRLFSPNGCAVWRPHRLKPRPHRRQTGGIAALEPRHAGDTPTTSV